MKKFAFALAAGLGMLLLNAAPIAADEPTTAPTPRVAAPAPIVTAGPVITGDYVTTVPQRRGLFGRLRNRGSMTASPIITTQPGTIITTPAPGTAAPPVGVPAPMPRPGLTPGTTNGPTTGIMPASGTTESYVVMSQPTTARRGLFGRLRSRGTTTLAMTPAPMSTPGATPIITTTPATGVIPTSGTIVTTDGTVITTDGSGVTTAGYTTPVQTRRGLFGRIRYR